jgi:hypothetical protein
MSRGCVLSRPRPENRASPPKGRLRADRCPPPLAFLTFHDGYRDNYEVAGPPCGSTASPASSARPQQHRHGQVRMARPAAIRGSAPGCHDSYELAHGRGTQRGGNAVRQPHADAPAPPTLTDDELAQELLESRRRLQALLGRCDAVAYPFGDWDSRTAAAAAGYRFAFALRPMSHAKVSA